MTYDQFAPVYDLLAELYSLGAIRRAKQAHIALLPPKQSILYVGAGTAAECLRAAQAGHDVSVLDNSPAMIARAQARFAAANVAATFICDDALAPRADWGSFDVVVAPFFLNVFAADAVPQVVTRLLRHLRPQGAFIVADFRAPQPHALLRLLQLIYYLPPLLTFFVLARNAWHGLYDYRRILADAALPLTWRDEQLVRALGVPLFSSQLWRHDG